MMRRLLILFLVLIAAPVMAASAPPTASSQPLGVNVDQGISLTLSMPASSVFIANPEIADVQVMSPTSIMVFGKRTGQTTFMATDNMGRTLEARTIIVTQDLGDLRRELDAAMPGNKIHAVAVPNGIVLTGEAKDAAAITDAYKISMRYLPTGGDIINRVKVNGSNQIQIRVRFAEVQRSVDNSLGFNWQNLANVGGFAFGIATGVTGVSSGNQILNTRPNNTTLNAPNDVIGFSRTGQHYSVNALIDALEQEGLITILAEPNLTAMSGETASFLAGGEFPIPIPQGNGTISIEFKDYGISLAFTPTLINDNRISLHVKPEVSELTTNGSITLNNIAVPALTTRRAETTVEVASGQSFAIAGLIDNSQTQTVNKYPLLGDMPVLGALFRSNQFQNGQTELVIIITPYVVTPSSDQKLALPTDGFSPPSESERLLGLRQSSGDPTARPMSGGTDAVLVPPPPPPIPPMSEEQLTPEAAPSVAVMRAAVSPPPSPVSVISESAAPPIVSTVPPVTASVMPATHIKLGPATSMPMNINPGAAPAGPGGFTLE